MAQSVEMAALQRSERGSRSSRKLRKQGRVPAVVYGHGEASMPVTVGKDDLERAIRHGVRVVDLKMDSRIDKALIRELQWDPLGHDILHVDFSRVTADERVTLDVRIEIRGTAPGVAAGGVLVQPLHNLSVECPVISVPDSIRVNVGELQMDQTIYVRDLKLPEGVVAKSDEDAIVVQVVPKEVVEEAGAPTGEEKAEPEVIGRKEEPAEGEEE